MRIAVAQMNSRADVSANLKTIDGLARRAKLERADLVLFPEMATFVGDTAGRLRVAEPLDGDNHQVVAALAAELGIEIVLGSVVERGTPEKHHNTLLWFGADGQARAVYRKIHLFDVDYDAVFFKESDSIIPGNAEEIVSLGQAKLGCTICYDLRFSSLFRALRDRGANVFLVPAAFTERTGRDHWEVLLRARAIEFQSYVVAAGQWGRHDDGRKTYGRSMIVDPWGTVLAQVPDGEGLAVADLDFERLADIRRSMPVFAHTRHSAPKLT